MTKDAFIKHAKTCGDVCVENDVIYVDIEDDDKYEKFDKFINRLGIPFSHHSMSDYGGLEPYDDVITYEIDTNVFDRLNIISVCNKTTGIIKMRSTSRKIGPMTISNMIDSIRTYPTDKIQVEIAYNVANIDEYHPFQ